MSSFLLVSWLAVYCVTTDRYQAEARAAIKFYKDMNGRSLMVLFYNYSVNFVRERYNNLVVNRSNPIDWSLNSFNGTYNCNPFNKIAQICFCLFFELINLRIKLRFILDILSIILCMQLFFTLNSLYVQYKRYSINFIRYVINYFLIVLVLPYISD